MKVELVKLRVLLIFFVNCDKSTGTDLLSLIERITWPGLKVEIQ